MKMEFPVSHILLYIPNVININDDNSQFVMVCANPICSA